MADVPPNRSPAGDRRRRTSPTTTPPMRRRIATKHSRPPAGRVGGGSEARESGITTMAVSLSYVWLMAAAVAY